MYYNEKYVYSENFSPTIVLLNTPRISRIIDSMLGTKYETKYKLVNR